MNLGCFGIMIAVALVWAGGQSTYVGLTNRTITEASIEDVIKQKPKAKWLRINDGQLDFISMVYEEKADGQAKDLYIPIRLEGQGDDVALHVIYHTKDPADLDIAHQMQALGDLNETELMMKLVSMRAELLQVRPVEGLVEFGIESDKGDGKARKMFDNLAPDAIMLEGGKKPSLGLGLGLLVLGLLLGFFCLGGLAKKQG